MELKSIEQLKEVKKFAENLGFKAYMRESGEYVYFEIGIPSAKITVYYEVLVGGSGGNFYKYASVSIGWSSADCGQQSITATNDFLKFMGHAVSIAEKLKE